jgi:hypothetical protein
MYKNKTHCSKPTTTSPPFFIKASRRLTANGTKVSEDPFRTLNTRRQASVVLTLLKNVIEGVGARTRRWIMLIAKARSIS